MTDPISSPTDRVLITAGAAGIGRAMGQAFEQSGSEIWVCDVDGDALDALPDAWSKTRLDVTDETAMAGLFGDIQNRWGRLDVVCANAGIKGPTAPVQDVALSDWKACVDVNLNGAFLTAKYAARIMIPQGSGTVIFTSSTGALGFPQRTAYAAAKAGVIALTTSLAMEWGPLGLRANVICPGSVDGPRMDRVIADKAAATGIPEADIRADYTSASAMRRFVPAAEIARAAVYLAQSQLVNGEVHTVDGFTQRFDT